MLKVETDARYYVRIKKEGIMSLSEETFQEMESEEHIYKTETVS